MSIILSVLGIAACIAFSAFFSASEMSFSSVNTVRMENLAEKGNKSAAGVLRIIRNFDDALSSILIGNNLVNIASSSLASVTVILITGNDDCTWVATAVITVLVIIFGETIPKISAKKNANSFALKTSGIITVLIKVMLPPVRAVTGLIHLMTGAIRAEENEDDDEAVEEFSTLIETAEDEGVLDEDSSEIMQAAIDFPELTAQECMTPRVDMQAIDIEDDLSEIVELIENTPYTRIPVYEGSPDEIIGILHLNRLFRLMHDKKGKFSKEDIKSLLMPPLYVYKTMDLPIVLKRMRDAKQHLAVVTDEYSGTEGIITLEDVLEEIVGDIWDETDEIEEEVRKIGESEYMIDGDMPIGDFLELTGINEDDFDFDSETVGGWVIEFMERFPKAGDSFDYEGFHTEVLSADDLRVSQVAVTKEK